MKTPPRKVPRLLAGSLLILFFSLFPLFSGRPSATPGPAPTPTPGSDARLFAQSPLGIAFAFPYDGDRPARIAERYRECGAKWVRLGHVPWGAIQPAPPAKGVASYDWARLDEFVLAWERAGFNVEIGITAISEWASGKGPKPWPYSFQRASPFSKRAQPPLSRHLGEFEAFVAALVERYDGDGEADLPGLAAPVLHFSFESWVQDPREWGGEMRDYGILLKAARSALKKACPQAKVLGPDLELADLVADDPDGQRLRRKFDALLPRLDPRARAATHRLRDLLAFFFPASEVESDIVSFRATGSLSTIPGTAAWLRERLSEQGKESPIWIGEARSRPSLGPGDGLGPVQIDSGSEEEKARAEIRRAMAMKLHPRHDETVAWYRAEQARVVAKEVVVALACGVKRVFVTALEDFPEAGSSWPYEGLVDPGGDPRPAYRALALLADKLGGVQSAEKVDAGVGVTVYRFHLAGGREQTWLWYDDGRMRAPGMEERTTSVAIAFSSPAVRITGVPTGDEKEIRLPAEMEVHGGRATFRIAATPVVVEPFWD